MQDNYIEKANEYFEKIKEMLHEIEGKDCKYEKEEDKFAFVFSLRICDSISSIVLLLENKKYFDACILSSHIIEGLIRLNWILKDTSLKKVKDTSLKKVKDTYTSLEKVKDYNDYEHLRKIINLEAYPDDDKTKEFKSLFEKNNLRRFLKNPDSNYLLTDSYKKLFDKKSIKQMADDLKGVENFNMLYNFYTLLCDYKHFSSFEIIKNYNNHQYVPDVPENEHAFYYASVSTFMVFLFVIDKINNLSNLNFDLTNYIPENNR